MEVRIIGLQGIPLVQENDNVASFILNSLEVSSLDLEDGDVFVIAETIIAKAEGTKIHLSSLKPSLKALKIAKKTGKEPELVESILQESNEILKVGPNFIISETKHGFVCANAGIDESNVELGKATPIPLNPDKSAEIIRKDILKATGKQVAVIISDTQGRPFREGAVGVAIGISGMEPLWDRQGETDLYGRKLQTTNVAVADELAAAASIVMGQADEGIPVVLIKGLNYTKKLISNFATAKSLIRPKKYDIFR
ncbi:MAG: coenzyme F420-0:L-glutamate ligase [Methanobacterium sp. BRmetb2]|jgi:coenzyme F420-0:L-glutamate ligase/coenzyme F420-1:gamma-L-glutamate ligase|nr:MAG: coenzyme F420-0:L-glutamate ligase [Methanobacterium sp. BRmetb2]